MSTTKTMYQNPFRQNSLSTLLYFITKYGIDLPYFGRACLFLLGTAIEFPFSIYEDFAYRTQIENTKINDSPIFVIGYWRSGTTYLHNILSQDLQWGTPSHMQVFYPKTFFTFEAFKSLLSKTLPEERGFDKVKVGIDVPEEEEEALLSYSKSSFYHAVIFPRIANEFFDRYALLNNLTQTEIDAWKKDYMWFLKKISLAFDDRPLLLKNPVNTCRISTLIELFPKARFIHIYRNPYEVFESNVKMIQIHTQNMRLQNLFPLEELYRGILKRYVMMMEAYDAQSQLVPEDRLIEISFEQIKHEPLKALESIYDRLNISGFQNALPLFEKYLDSQKQYKQNNYQYHPETVDIVDRNWDKWIERWGYQPPVLK
ncbi:sulfotransferase family protein [Baaleninema simplex]|uniref:sulfotransferase family protein n=1 Tax=Baaleninema simplex TaxID=2862350 RepID=UPI00034C2752|nr:sulfotransferase [Baaleninema simplex]